MKAVRKRYSQIFFTLAAIPLGFFQIVYASDSSVKSTSIQPEIIIDFLKLETNKWNEKECDINYELKNLSTGTLHNIYIKFSGRDDRGRDVTFSVMGHDITLDQPVELGGSSFGVIEGFETKCKYLQEINVRRVNDCNVRMMPEDAECRDWLTLKSNLEQLILK